MSNEETLDDVIAMLREQRSGMLTTVGEAGLVSRPMTVLDVDDQHVVWAMLPTDSDTAEQLAADARVNFAFTGNPYLSVSGTAAVMRDRAKIDELWNPHAGAWFDGGADDPCVGLLRLVPDSIAHWETPSAPVYLLRVANSLVSDDKPGGGDSGVVQA